MDDEGDAEDVVELGGEVGRGDAEPVEEGHGRAGLEELEALDLENEVAAEFAEAARRDHPLAE